MIEQFTPDGQYRPYPYPMQEGFIVQAFILFRGSVNKIIYSEPCLTNNGALATAPYFFPTRWAAERKCRQLNGDTSDPNRLTYKQLAREAGTIESMLII